MGVVIRRVVVSGWCCKEVQYIDILIILLTPTPLVLYSSSFVAASLYIYIYIYTSLFTF